MDPRTFADAIIRISQVYNITNDNIEQLITKILVISMKYIDQTVLWSHLFNDDFVDWVLLQRNKDNILGGTLEWIHLLDLMSWNHLEKHEAEIMVEYPILSLLRKHIKEVNLDPGGGDGWTLACKIKILTMIIGLPTLKAIDIFTCNVFKRSTTQACMNFLALQAENMYSKKEQMHVMHYILKMCTMDVSVVQQNIVISQALKNDNQIYLKQKRMQVVEGRPRLRDRLTVHQNSSSSEGVLMNTWETYTGFCYKHQFPPTLSETIKKKLYYMAAQVHWKTWRNHVHRIAPVVITDKVKEYPVMRPDLNVITQVIEDISMDGKAPFAALNHFRAVCFQSLPISHIQKMTVTQFLQLYASVYQSPLIWKDLWKHFIGVISVQIIRDCELYINSNRFDEDSFMNIF